MINFTFEENNCLTNDVNLCFIIEHALNKFVDTAEEPMPTPTFDHLPEDKKERIFSAAVKEFGQRNIMDANLSNIVKDAKIARGSIYQYFSTKEDLYIYVFDTLRARRAEYVNSAYELFKKAPFLTFFQEFYLRDSEFLLLNPAHIELGKQLYGCSSATSQGLIRQIQNKYKEKFIIGIEYDKYSGIMDHHVDSAILADLCVHMVTDIFIFQSIYTQLSMSNLRYHCEQTMYLLEHGTKPRGEKE